MAKYHDIYKNVFFFFDKRFRSFMSRTVIIQWKQAIQYKNLFPLVTNEDKFVNLPLLMSNENKNISGSLSLDLRKW